MPSRILSAPPLRSILQLFAFTLGIAGAWVLAPELVRPPRVGFPVDQNYSAAADQRPRTALSAQLGIVRGDLWAQLFFSFADSIGNPGGRDFGAMTTTKEAVPAAQRALSYAPYQSEVWLLLADMAEKYELPNPKSHAALIMSYYTAPSNVALTPLRLSVALRGDTLQDTEIQRFVDRDLRAILSGIPELRPAIATAYATASVDGRRFVESIVQQIDPSFLESL